MATLNSTIVNGFLRVVDKVKAKSLEVEDNAVVENLNADLLDGQQGSYYATSQGLTDLTTQVNTNTGNILTNMQGIATNKEAIATNKGNITNLTTRVTTAEGNITTNANSIKSLQTKTDTTNTNVTNLTARVKTNEDNIAALVTKTNTTNTNVSNLSSQVSTNAKNIQTNANDISALKTKTDTTNTNVANNTSRIDSILAGTAEIPSVANAEEAENAKKLGGQLPAYYATAASLNNYLPLVGGTVTGASSITKILGKSTSTSLGVYGLKGLTSDICSVMYEPDLVNISKIKRKHYMVVTSAGNSIKKLDLEDFLTVPPSGIIYTKLADGDVVADVSIVADGMDVVIYSGHKALRVNIKDIPHYKRNSVGVIAMNTNDKIEGINAIYDDVTHIIVITRSGKINKIDVAGLGRGKRAQAGNNVIKLGRSDSIIGIYGVNDHNQLRVITTANTYDIRIADIATGSSMAAGAKIPGIKGSEVVIKAKLFLQ